MSHKLYDITLYYYSQTYNEGDLAFRQNLVSDLYVLFLDNYKPKGTTRISVTLKDEDYVTGYFGSILSVYAYFDEVKYWGSNTDEQNRIILNTVHRIAILCADKFGWDKSVFQNAYKKVLASGFVYKQEQKRKFSKDRNHQASLLIEKDGRHTITSVLFYDKKGNLLKTIELLKSLHNSWFHEGITKNNKWFSNSEFGIYIKKEELVIKVSLDHLNKEIIISPKINSREKLEGYLERITYTEYEIH